MLYVLSVAVTIKVAAVAGGMHAGSEKLNIPIISGRENICARVGNKLIPDLSNEIY